MKVALYVRVSTADKGQDPELQLGPLRGYAKIRGWETVEYVDIGTSGASERRPELDRILEDARKRRFDGILVWKLDRLGRNLRCLLNQLEEFRVLGVQFCSLTENLDFSTPSGKAMGSLIGVFAEFERDLLRERIRAGLQNARTKGRRLGRRPIFDIGHLRTIERLRGQGKSYRQIAKEMRVSKSLVHKTLKNRPLEAPEN